MQQGDGEIVIGSKFFLARPLLSRRCGTGFAEKFDRLLLVALSLKHHPHVDIELRVGLTMSISLLQLGHHLHGSLPLARLFEADCEVGARFEEGGLRIWVWSILSCYILILIGLDLDHLLIGLVIENQSILHVLSLIIYQGDVEIRFGKLLCK